MSPSRHGNSQHQDPHSSDPDYFLIPSLLSSADVPSIPQYAAPGYVKLERRYVLDKFIPPGLLQRIMARTYFKYGSTRLQDLTKNCWKYAFHQGFHGDVIDIWVWLDTEANYVRLVGFGNIFKSQEIIKRLDKYSQAVADILATFPVCLFFPFPVIFSSGDRVCATLVKSFSVLYVLCISDRHIIVVPSLLTRFSP